MATYPSYGEILLDSFGEQAESAVLRTPMEKGPAKQARVRSRIRIERPIVHRMSSADYILWKAWHNATIEAGVLSFDWTNPLTGSTEAGRIVEGRFSAVPYNNGLGALMWDVSFTLETYE